MPVTPAGELHDGAFAIERADGQVTTVEFLDGTYITRAPGGEYRACNESGEVLYSGPLQGAWNWLEFARAMSDGEVAR